MSNSPRKRRLSIQELMLAANKDQVVIPTPTQVIFEQISTEPKREMIEPNIVRVQTEGPARARYDRNTNTLTVELLPYMIDWQIDLENFNVNYGRGYVEYGVNDVGYAVVDPDLIPTCQHMVPSKSAVEDGADLPKDWKFIRAKKTQRCTCPNLIPAPGADVMCNYGQDMYKCREYAAEGWSRVAHYERNGEQVVRLERLYTSFRVPSFKVLDEVGQTLYEGANRTEAYEKFAAAGNGLEGAMRVEAGKNHTSYLNTVLV